MSLPPRIDVLLITSDDDLCRALLRDLHAYALTTDTAAEIVEARRLLARASYHVVVVVDPDAQETDEIAEMVPSNESVIVRVSRAGDGVMPALMAPSDAKSVAATIFALVIGQTRADV